VIAAVLAAPVHAQQPDIGALTKRFQELYAARDYAAALVEARKLEVATKARFGIEHVNYAGAVEKLASVYHAQAAHAEAEPLYKRALAIYEKAKGSNDPNVARTLNGLADVYEKQARYDLAEALYKRAFQIDPKLVSAREGAARVQRLAAAGGPKVAPAPTAAPQTSLPAAADDRSVCFNVNSGPDARIEACGRVISSGQLKGIDLASTYSRRAEAYRTKGDYDRAIADYNEEIRLNPKYATAYVNRGLAYDRKGDNDRAIRDYEEAIRLDPKYAIAYSNRGDTYFRKGDDDRAIRDYDEAIRLDPKFAVVYISRGRTYDRRGDYDRAIRDYDEAIRLASRTSHAYYHRGLAFERKGDMERALADLRRALELDPNQHSAHYAIARVEATTKLATPAVPPVAAPSPAVPAEKPAPPLATSAAGRRIALVIGNDRYPNLPADKQLAKAVNDARAVGDALEKLGFTVIRGENLDRNAMVDRIHAFTQQIREGDMAVVFFAGHGVALGGGNYILPTDVPSVKPGEEARMRNRAIGEAELIGEIQEKKARVAVLLLDACRDNPFRQPGILRTVGGDRGLARAQQAEGVFAVYSAGFGQSALDSLGADDASPNSVFTRALLPALARGDTHLSDLIIDMRQEVARLARTIDRWAHLSRPARGREMMSRRAPSQIVVIPVEP
jgi:tetratricopeptide (TPR) repeat protein